MKTSARTLSLVVPMMAALSYLAVLPSAKATDSHDLDGDGHHDLLFQNNAGQVYAWLLDGTGNGVDFRTGSGLKPGSKFLYGGGLGDWKICGRADINGDGIADLVFQNNAGQVYVWFLDGSGNGVDFRTGSGLKPGSKFLYSGALGDWKIKGVSDINGDGIADLVFQNRAGQVYVWFLDGSGNSVDFRTGSGLKPGSKFLYGSGLGDWKIKGIGDLNGDGIKDLVFQNNAGQVYVWFLDGTGNTIHFTTGSGLKPGSKFIYPGVLGDWKIRGVDDLNGDGHNDLIFQNNAGQVYAWFLDDSGNAVNFTSGSGLRPGSKFLYSGGLGDWRVSDDDPSHDVGDDHGVGSGEVDLTNTLTRTGAAPSGATAKVELTVQGSSVELEIEVQDVPVGSYNVTIGGTVRGTVSVVTSGGGTRGRLKFEASPDQAGELLLNFPASRQPVQISQGSTTLFTGTSPTAP